MGTDATSRGSTGVREGSIIRRDLKRDDACSCWIIIKKVCSPFVLVSRAKRCGCDQLRDEEVYESVHIDSRSVALYSRDSVIDTSTVN